MKHVLLALILLISVFLGKAQAAELVKVSRLNSKDLIQIYFSFDKPPAFKVTSNSRRVDLIFTDSVLSPTATLFSPDEEIVKILPRFEKNDLIISLFFRYKPQNFKLAKSSDDKIVFEALLGNEYSKTYQELAERLKGISEIDRISTDITHPSIQSPYAKDWMSFFSNFESPVLINVPVKFTPPPFPIIRFLPPGLEENLKVLPDQFLELVEKGSAGVLADMLYEKLQQTQNENVQKLLALSFGEALILKGDFEGAFKQLYLLKEQYHEELLGTYADFLLVHLKAKYQDSNIAEYEYQTMETTLGKNNPLAPYLYLAQLEAALASGKFKHMNELLIRDNIALPDELLEIVQIRNADYWYAVKKPIKAFAAYQLLANSKILRTLPYSLNGFCSSFYDQKKYREAALCYEQLSPIVTDKSLMGIIAYKKDLAKLKYENSSTLIGDFAQIENTNSGTEAGFRAALKKNDLRYLQDKNLARQALEKYGEIAENSDHRAIREEAMFKQAVIHSQLGELAKSILLLEQFLREFQVSDIRISAQALLIDILPAEIKRLIEQREYVKALVLAKKNKELFRNSWISGKFLIDIAEAYQRVGLFDEAQKLYLYLIEIMPVEQRERFYLPMIQSTFDQGAYSLVEDYAAQYSYNYPKGQDSDGILIIRLGALSADGRLAEALKLLPSPLPDNKAMYSIAGTLYFRTDDYVTCLDVLKKLSIFETPLPVREQFMMAESLFQTGAFSEAEIIFQTIPEGYTFYEQALFRLASLERKKGNEQKALSLFKKIVETGKSSQWKKYAEQELQFARVSTRRR